jgi:hypothetical protein
MLTSRGSAVLILSDGIASVAEAQTVRLDEFSEANLSYHLHGIGDGVYDGWMWHLGNGTDPRRWRDAIENITQILFDEMCGPVHEYLMKRGVDTGAPMLLPAQGGTRDVTNAELSDQFRTYRDNTAEFDGLQAAIRNTYRRFTLAHPSDRPFSHPIYWAGFVLNGA